MASETTTANPELLAEQVANLLVQPLEAAVGGAVLRRAHLRHRRGAAHPEADRQLGGRVHRRGTSDPLDHDTTFDELVLMPTDRKSLKTIERYTNELVRQSVIGIDAVLKNRLVKVVGDSSDTELLVGTGASAGITGIVSQAGVQTGALDVTDADSLLDAIALASAAEVTPNHWFVNGQDFIALRKLKEATAARSTCWSPTSPPARRTGCSASASPPTNKLPEGKAVLADTARSPSRVISRRRDDPASERYADTTRSASGW